MLLMLSNLLGTLAGLDGHDGDERNGAEDLNGHDDIGDGGHG